MAPKKIEYIKVTEPLNEGIVKLFESITDKDDPKELADAWDFIKVRMKEIFPPKVIQIIIFKLMLKCKLGVVTEAGIYLRTLHNLLPPSELAKYINSNCLGTESSDAWSNFTYFADSILHHYTPSDEPDNVYKKFASFPACEYIFAFYVDVLTKSNSLSVFYEENFDERFATALEWVNFIYKHRTLRSTVEIFHDLLDRIILWRILETESSLQTAALNGPLLSNIFKVFRKICKDVFIKFCNIECFLLRSQCQPLLLRICWHRLHELTFKQDVPSGSELTLKSIVDFYLCKKKDKENSFQDSKSKFKRKRVPSVKLRKSAGGSVLHKLAREGNYGDLLEKLDDNKEMDINEKNSLGYTPLHEACLSNSYHSARFLIDSSGSRHVDFVASDNDGRVPLHCAVLVDAGDIVKLLLSRGGNEQTQYTDINGLKPLDLCNSDQIRDLLMEREPAADDALSSDLTTRAGYSMPQSKEEFTQMLHLLHSLLSLYLELFSLLEWPSAADALPPASHAARSCCHFWSVRLRCQDDVRALSGLPDSLDASIVLWEEEAGRIGVDVREELQPLLELKESLQGPAEA